MSIIYKTTNTINGKIYIGQAAIDDPTYLGSGIQITGAIKKYGRDKFNRQVIEECSTDVVNSREIYWIKFYNAIDRKVGYNISAGGTGGNHFWSVLTTDEKIEHCDKIKRARKGQKMPKRSEEFKNKQSQNMKAWLKENPERIEASKLRRCKWFVCIDHNSRIVYRTKNLKLFCAENNMSYTNMLYNASTLKNYVYGHWSCMCGEFIEDDETLIDIAATKIKNNNSAYKQTIGKYMRKNNEKM
jgi:hypothetical protein